MSGDNGGRATVADGYHVLHVDDDPAIAELAAEFLQRENDRFHVEVVTDAADGCEYLDEHDVDGIISDYEMPNTNGIEFLQSVREHDPDLPFILYTGKGSEEVASAAISAGVTDYLQKETGTDQYALLANRLTNAIEHYRATTARRRQLAAIERAREGISILDTDGEFVYVNDAYADLYGYTPAEMLGEHWSLIYVDDEIPFAEDVILPTVDRDGYWEGETTGLRADGSTFPEDHVVSATEHGELVCTIRDASTTRGPDVARRDDVDHRYPETILDAFDDPVYALDADSRFTYVNAAFTDLVGYEREDLLASDATLVTDDRTLDAVDQALTARAETDTADAHPKRTIDVDITPRNGDPIHCQADLTALPTPDDTPDGTATRLHTTSG
ncbi:PAS domain-containing response regulator [Halorubellus salinus]|uniref:PAS domain-containing response regulator n=1 Tax=Halorubellus salinus TaxID=755309 RepID=UPI001D0845EE|nr:response regulator [Halorubellus salinus]